ncbi:MAG: hypothetical protein ACR2NU_12885 [Aeoliella sp.]
MRTTAFFRRPSHVNAPTFGLAARASDGTSYVPNWVRAMGGESMRFAMASFAGSLTSFCLASVHDAVITKLADITGSIESMDQGMTVLGATFASSSTVSMSFHDADDFGDTLQAHGNSQCLINCNGLLVARSPRPLADNEQNLPVV